MHAEPCLAQHAQRAEPRCMCERQSYSFGLFAECYQCPPKHPASGLWG